MSFNFSFAARTLYSAKAKLDQAYAPAAVKALVEKALDAVAWPQPAPGQVQAAGLKADRNSASGFTVQTVGCSAPVAPPAVMMGVFVEVWGHIAEHGELPGKTEIQRFIVQPLYD